MSFKKSSLLLMRLFSSNICANSAKTSFLLFA
ncbi:Uncharacterised protein [Vibrio cholerae]|nr:Uncharacterised protein [Vibrio cholerae]